MSMHKILLVEEAEPVNIFTAAVPPIAAGSELYIQNISNNDVFFSETTDMSAPLIITEKGTATSVVSMSAGDDGYLDCKFGDATLTIVAKAV